MPAAYVLVLFQFCELHPWENGICDFKLQCHHQPRCVERSLQNENWIELI